MICADKRSSRAGPFGIFRRERIDLCGVSGRLLQFETNLCGNHGALAFVHMPALVVAIAQIAKLTRELEKAEGFKGNQYKLPLAGGENQTKEQQIRAAGLVQL